MAGRIDGKVVLITGAAQGQGEAEARLFVTEGARVVITDVQDAAGKALAAKLGEACVFARLDVTQEADWRQAVDRTLATFHRVDVLVNNAGIGVTPDRFERQSFNDHRRVVQTNLDGVYLGMRAVTPIMTAQGSGSIVNVSSIDGIVGVAGMTSYVASKFAVTGMTRSAALELGRRGIRVNSIHPGIIDTPLVRRASREMMARLQAILDRQAIPRMGSPEEVAYLALYLASDESSYCTGAQFVIDGGHTAGPYRPGFDDVG